jgi:hypothetical protein
MTASSPSDLALVPIDAIKKNAAAVASSKAVTINTDTRVYNASASLLDADRGAAQLRGDKLLSQLQGTTISSAEHDENDAAGDDVFDNGAFAVVQSHSERYSLELAPFQAPFDAADIRYFEQVQPRQHIDPGDYDAGDDDSMPFVITESDLARLQKAIPEHEDDDAGKYSTIDDDSMPFVMTESDIVRLQKVTPQYEKDIFMQRRLQMAGQQQHETEQREQRTSANIIGVTALYNQIQSSIDQFKIEKSSL